MKINCLYLIGVLVIVAFTALSQPAETNFVASVSEENRMDIVKTSIHPTEWHEKLFWTQYKSYLSKMQRVSSLAYTLQKLAQTDKNTNSEEALKNGCRLIAYHQDELNVKRQYFAEIGRDHNGTMALQFLQIEIMLDMMESSNVYEHSVLREFSCYPKAYSAKMKHNLIAQALSLSDDEMAAFFPVYARYEKECGDVLGEDYNLYELFAGEASDFTPNLAKRQGYDLLAIMEREIKLKEKYFDEMNLVLGPSLAARFLAWEDYYSIACKMYVWAQAQ